MALLLVTAPTAGVKQGSANNSFKVKAGSDNRLQTVKMLVQYSEVSNGTQTNVKTYSSYISSGQEVSTTFNCPDKAGYLYFEAYAYGGQGNEIGSADTKMFVIISN